MFLDNHGFHVFAADFLTVPTTTFRILFAQVVLRHKRLKVVCFYLTAQLIVVARVLQH